QFVATLTGNSDATGSGTFSLTTNRLTYDVQLPYGYDQAQIRSPWPDPNAPVVFDLRLSYCDPPGPGPNPGGCFFKAGKLLSEGQITDLEGGAWFVTSFNLSGQIILVPEPSFVRLGGLFLAMWRIFKIRKT